MAKTDKTTETGKNRAKKEQEKQPTLAERLRECAASEMVRVAPDAYAWKPRVPGNEPEGLAVCRWTKGSDGAWRPMPLATRLVRVNAELMACLGFQSGRRRQRYDTLLRLARANFIDMVRPSPGVWMLDLATWYRHLAACAEDPEMWDRGSEALEHYNFTNALGGWKHRKRRTRE